MTSPGPWLSRSPLRFMFALNFIRVFDIYLVMMFIVSIVMRYRQYREIVDLVLSVPERWPRLFMLASDHKSMFVSWAAAAPVLVTFAMMLLQTIASQFIWRTATVTPGLLWEHPWLLSTLAVLAAAMLVLDYDAVFNVGRIDRPQLEKNLDQAEYWLKSWVGGAVRIVTFGFVDPRKMVANEVRNNLAWLRGEMGKMMWRWALQIGVRLAFGLTLWLSWALA